MAKLEYINEDKLYGIKYDYNLILKTYKKLKIPKNVYSPEYLLQYAEECKWFVLMSARGLGKTTNLILLGMCFNKHYGTTIEYIRNTKEMIMPKVAEELFSVIRENGYIEKITEGKYNDVRLKSRKWYYIKRDKEGKIVDEAPEHFMSMLALDGRLPETYKSGYNAPRGDFVIYDEFLSRFYYSNLLVDFLDVIDTIRRKRQSLLIFASANTINKQHMYFHDLSISQHVKAMKMGDKIMAITPKKMHIYVEIMSKTTIEKTNKFQKDAIKYYYGFESEQINAITGEDTWNIDLYPPTPKDYEIITRIFYIRFKSELINLELCRKDGVYFVNTHLATQTYPDSHIFTLDKDPTNSHEFYGCGYLKTHKFIFDLIKKGQVTYATNDIGSLLESYLMEYKKNPR